MKVFLTTIIVVLVVVAALSTRESYTKPGGTKTATSSSDAPTTMRVTFENETVTSSTQEFFDEIQTTLPTGEMVVLPIQYEAGTNEDRYARIIPDPAQADNDVLQFWLKNARIPGAREGYYKGRVQMQLTGMQSTQTFARYRMYLPADMNHYRSYPKENKWFAVTELWSGKPDDAYRFLISLDIVKETGIGKPLYFLVSGEKRISGSLGDGQWQPVWGGVNKDFEISVGEWIDIETGYKQGNKSTGRYYLAAKRASDAEMITIFDFTNWTYHPSSPKPMPLTQWNPVKLYTSGEVVDHIRDQGGVAQIYWDDLEMSNVWEE